MMSRVRISALTLGLVAFFAHAPLSDAAVLAQYNFGPDGSTTSFASADANPLTNASDLSDAALTGTRHEFVTATLGHSKGREAGASDNLSDGIGGSGYPHFAMTSDNFNTNSTFGDDAGRYLDFSIMATGGDITAWDMLTFNWARSDATAYNARLLWSTEDTDGTFALIGSATGFGPSGTDDWFVAPAIDISSLAPLAGGDTLYFRLQFAADSGNFANNRSLMIDDITVSGTAVAAANGGAVVPEPTAAALTLLGLGGLALRRRRQVG